MIRFASFAAIAAFSTVVAVAPAQAHVTLETASAAAGAGYKAVLRVPHGCAGSPTVRLRVAIPEGVIAVKPMPKPGWTVETVSGRYARAYDLWGKQISEGVREIVWSGGRLPDSHYDEFVFVSRIASGAAGDLLFPTVQQCETGENRWVDSDASARSPAPLLRLAQAPASGHAHGHGHNHAAPAVIKAGDLTIERPWTRATPRGAAVAGGFMRIVNAGTQPDRLIGGTMVQSGRFEVHEMAVDGGGVMRMREVAGGIVIPPGGSVELKPGGYHVMFIDLKAPLEQGRAVKGTLVFERAGTVEVEYAVEALAARGGHEGHGAQGHGAQGHRH